MIVIVKTTQGCNADCSYCSAWRFEAEGKAPRVPLDTIYRLLDELEAHSVDHPQEIYTLVWHGGEPLMLGVRFYNAVADYIETKPEAFTSRLRHSFQSNITFVSEKHIEVFKRLDANIGTSVDPFSDVRSLPGSGSYMDRWLDAFLLLKRNGFHNVGCVYVVHREVLPHARDLYYYFKNLGVNSVRFNGMYSEGLAKSNDHLSVTPLQYSEFLLELYDIWEADDRRFRHIPPVSEWVYAMEGGTHGKTCDSKGICADSFLSIDAKGNMFNCGRYSDSLIDTYGNILEDDFTEMLHHPARIMLQNRVALLRHGECKGCQWFDICGGGCPNLAKIGNGSSFDRTSWCEGRKHFYNTVSGHLKQSRSAVKMWTPATSEIESQVPPKAPMS